MRFQLHIKSHADYPDFEQVISTKDIGEAIERFYELLEGEYNRDYISENIQKL